MTEKKEYRIHHVNEDSWKRASERILQHSGRQQLHEAVLALRKVHYQDRAQQTAALAGLRKLARAEFGKDWLRAGMAERQPYDRRFVVDIYASGMFQRDGYRAAGQGYQFVPG